MIFFILLGVIFQINVESKFPKILWIYWQSGIENAPFITQLCVQNMKRIAQSSGWIANIISRQTVMDYIYDKHRFEKIHQNAKVTMGLQKQADVIRLFLIYNYGGVWVDANSFFIDSDMGWIENIEKFPYVVNKHGSDPDVLLFQINGIQGDTRIQFVEAGGEAGGGGGGGGETQNEKIRLCPGNEVWFIAAKPKAELIKDWLAQFELYIVSGYEFVKNKNEEDGTVIGQFTEAFGKDYLFANRAIQSTLQVKQKQLNKARGEGQPPQFAVIYYNLWTIDSTFTGYHLNFMIGWQNKLMIEHLTQKTAQQVQSKIGRGYFLIKMNSGLYHQINPVIDPEMFNVQQHQLKRGKDLYDQNPMTCQQVTYPKQFIIKDSYIQTYLIRHSKHQKAKLIALVDIEDYQSKCSPDTLRYIRNEVVILLLYVYVFLLLFFIYKIIQYCINRRRHVLIIQRYKKCQQQEI